MNEDVGLILKGGKPKVAREKKLRHWVWIVAQEKLSRQVSGLKMVLQKAKIDFYGTFPVEVRTNVQREYIRQLEIEVAKLEEGMKELRKMQADGKVRVSGLWDSIMIRLYSWSVLGK